MHVSLDPCKFTYLCLYLFTIIKALHVTISNRFSNALTYEFNYLKKKEYKT